HTANNRVAPDDHAAPLYGSWAGGNRARRIRERLDSTAKVSPAESRAVQQDVFMHRAALMSSPIAKMLAAAEDRDLRQLADLLASWDNPYTLDTTAPTVFEAIAHRLAGRIVTARVPTRLAGLLQGNGMAVAARLLEGEPIQWLATRLEDEVLGAAR